tara:strand:+ start:134 stop:298 length:165 start_codon:yes stop_codon:yes gene_type:complete
MSVPQHEGMLEDLAEEWHSRLVADGWPKNSWETWHEARDRARAEWEGKDRVVKE